MAEATERIPIYWWFDQAPDNLKTRAQLAAEGLKPGGPVCARVEWRRGQRSADLYDVGEAKPKKPPTEAQLAALVKANAKRDELARTCSCCGRIGADYLPAGEPCSTCEDTEHIAAHAADRACATRWAQRVLADQTAVILDTETTGLDGWIVQVAVIDVQGRVLLDTLIHPQQPIPDTATAIHGITDADVSEAPTFGNVFAELSRLLEGQRVVVYNKAFDMGRLWDEVYRLHGGDQAAWCEADAWLARYRWQCAMERWSAWVGEVRENGEYRWQRLPGGDHTALGDCQATLAVLRRMVGTS